MKSACKSSHLQLWAFQRNGRHGWSSHIAGTDTANPEWRIYHGEEGRPGVCYLPVKIVLNDDDFETKIDSLVLVNWTPAGSQLTDPCEIRA